MARRKSKFNDGHLTLQHSTKWKELLKPAKNVRFFEDRSADTFLGFRLIKRNTNQLWRWDTLEDINYQT